MSGIYGIYRYDGAPVDPAWLERMRTAMGYYGPDGGGCRIAGPIGFGHLLLVTNPEDAYEQQPVAGARGPVVASARLDNREELLTAFGVAPSDAQRVPDGQLVSLAFDRWGEELCAHLQGDWSLAAWDVCERRMLLARDVCGTAALYYYQGKGFIAFASSMKALLALPGVVKEPDLLRLAEVLVSWQHDAELTAYMGYKRVVWAQALTFNAIGQSHSWQHWSPLARERLNFRRDEEYIEAFLEHYKRAVQSCLRSSKPISAQLSGGRDSGSVAVIAAPLLALQGRELTAYTSVPLMLPDGAEQNKRLGNEWEQAHATALMAGGNLRHRPVDAEGYGVLQGIEHFLELHDGPSHATSNHYWIQAVTEAAVRDGAGLMLFGQFGNAGVSWAGNGSALLALCQHEKRTAWQLLLHGESNPWYALKRQILKPLLIPAQRFARRFNSSRYQAWRNYSALHPRMAEELRLGARMRAAGYDPSYSALTIANKWVRFFKPDMGAALSMWSEIGARHAISFRDPTTNLPLLEFLLRVPDSQFVRHGQRSSLIQRAFQGRLPAVVLEGRRKGLQAADVGHRILRERSLIVEALESLNSVPLAGELLDLPSMRQSLDDLTVSVNPVTSAQAGYILLRGLGVGLFLRHLS